MTGQNQTLYLKLEQNSVIRQRKALLGDVASMECGEQAIVRQLKQLQIFQFPRHPGREKKMVQTFSVLKVISLIHEQYPNLTVENLGETDFVLHYKPKEDPKAWQLFKTCLICLILFFGAAFMIMTFNNDVAVPEVFDKFYTQVMGMKPSGVTVLEISYCVGLPVGILIFYNHIGKKKITDDPTPVQVAMRKYEQDVDMTYIEESSREGKTIDVD